MKKKKKTVFVLSHFMFHGNELPEGRESRMLETGVSNPLKYINNFTRFVCVCVCGLCEHIVFPLVFFLSLSPPLPIITVVLWEFRLQMERVIQRTRYHKIPMVFFSHHFRLIQLFIFIPIFSFRCPCLCSISTRLNLGAGNSGPCDL